MEKRTAVGFAKTLQMLQYRHKEVFTTSYNFDFKSKRSIWRLENTRKKCLSNVRRPTGSPGSQTTTHNNFVFEFVLIFILNLAMQKTNKQTKKHCLTFAVLG